MSIVVNLADDRVRLERVELAVRGSDALAFTVDGAISIGEALLGEFAGRTIEPESITFTVDGEDRAVDLRDEATLRLETIDVGVEVPDVDDAPSSVLDAPTGGTDAPLGAVSFTVEGVLGGLDEETTELLAGASSALSSLTLSARGSLENDGGSGGTDRLAAFTLLD